MSQAKVEEHKEEKRNRKETVRKQKRNRLIASIVGVIACAALAFWVGWSIYGKVQDSAKDASADKKTVVTQVDMSALTEYLSGIVKD